MGEARAREQEMASLKANGHQPQQISMAPGDLIVMLELDLAVHMLTGIASQLKAVNASEPRAEVLKSIGHLQAYRDRFVNSKRTGLVIAQPGDVPAPKLVP